MLSKENTELLCRVGAGTVMGDMMRQYWLPCVYSWELTPDGDPLRVRLLGEDLIAWRDTNGTPGFIASFVVLLVIGVVAVLPTRTFHKVVTALAGYGVLCFVAMFIFGLAATSRSSFEAHLPKYTGGVTAAKIAASGKADFIASSHHFWSDIFSTTVFPFMLSILLFQYIGFQYSAYIAGEVRGNVKRGVLVALVGALVIGVLANSF